MRNWLCFKNRSALVGAWILGFVGFSLQVWRVESWGPAVAVLSAQLACVLVAILPLRLGYKGEWKFISRTAMLCAALALGVTLHLCDLRIAKFWASESLIVNDALQILNGQFINPFRPSGDFPTSFMSYPAALFLAFISDVRVAVRLVGVVALLFFSLGILATVSLVTGRKYPLVVLLPFFFPLDD